MENKRWMTAREVADRWGMADFELLDAFSKGLMAVNQKSGNWIFQITEPIKFKDETVGKIELLYEEDTTSLDQPPIPVSDKKKCTDWIFNDRVLFDMNHVLEFEAAHGLTSSPPVEIVATVTTVAVPAPVPEAATMKAPEPITVPTGTTWHQVNMCIVTKELMAVKYPGGHTNLKRGKDGLTKALWTLLLNLATGNGEFHYLEPQDKKNVATRATAKRLNDFLKTLFPDITEPERPIIGTTGKYQSVFGITHQLDKWAVERGMAEDDEPRSLHDELNEEFFSDMR